MLMTMTATVEGMYLKLKKGRVTTIIKARRRAEVEAAVTIKVKVATIRKTKVEETCG